MSNPNKENPNQAAHPAELNVEHLELLNKGVLEKVAGRGRIPNNSTDLFGSR